MMRRSQRGFEPSLVPIQAFGAKALSQKRRDKYEDASECPGFEYDRVYGFQSLCAVCKFPKRLHPKDASFMFEVTKSPSERLDSAPRWVPYGSGYVRSDSMKRRSSRAGSRLSARLSRRLSDAVVRRRASSAGEAREEEPKVLPLESLSEGDEDPDTDSATSTEEEQQQDRRRSSRNSAAQRRSHGKRASARRAASADDDSDDDEKDDARPGSKRLSSRSKRVSSASMRSSAARHRGAATKQDTADEDEDTEGEDEDVVAPVAARRASSGSRRSEASRHSRHSHSRSSSRRDARDDDEKDEQEEDRAAAKRVSSRSRRSSRASSRASSTRISASAAAAVAAATAAAAAARADSDEHTDGDGDSESDAGAASKRASAASSRRGSLAQRISQRVSAAVRTSRARLSRISEGSERASAASDADDADAAAAGGESALARSLGFLAGQFSVPAQAGEDRASSKRGSRASGRGSARSSRSRDSRAAAAAAAGTSDSESDASAAESYEEEDYDAWVGKQCRAMFHDTEEFHPAEVVSHDGGGLFTVRFLKSGTLQDETDSKDVQVMDAEHDLRAPAEGRVDYNAEIDSLFEACERKDPIALQVLLQQGHDPDERNGMRETPLVLAARVGDAACAKMLLQFGASDEDGAALAAAGSPEMQKLVTEFGFGKTSKQARLVRDSSGRLDVVRKHLSESAATARRGRKGSGGKSRASHGSGGSAAGGGAAAGAAGEGRGASWPLSSRDAEEARAEGARASGSMRSLRRRSSGLKKVLCFAGAKQ